MHSPQLSALAITDPAAPSQVISASAASTVVGIPYTWLDGVTSSKVFDQLDTLSARDHYPVLVSVRGHIDSKETMPRAPRLDARWIRKRDPTELTAAVGALARTPLPQDIWMFTPTEQPSHKL